MEEARLYKKYREGKHWENHPTVYADRFIKFLKDNNFNNLIVDAGCGNGRDLEVFQKGGYKTIGIDCSKEEINNAKRLHPQLNFEVQDIEKMNFQNNEVSAFFCINVIHYVNKERALSEFLRCLKDKGYLFIHFNVEIKDKEGNTDYSHSEKDILELVSKFRIVKKRIIERDDIIPVKHHHKIMELILQKPYKSFKKNT